ncbi:MAG: M20/M25/M40 family metallo-hydrolase [Gemmatimonadetes bacterium]|jgi:acetylornithine deacetylase/succinyl-diaminopimelate desuccinylase-like protein|nr:M20/M25/M40 family metallo-hydrolase [Gemmatimonadota bacterium]MBT6149523.1 M20/M25/M40 family metallo-hydrolase [Gemmatimonadota bacterium]MBT7860497.1 M20/M25/M40 family metallo-hydrolase [Gemmatimonadota bacterium]
MKRPSDRYDIDWGVVEAEVTSLLQDLIRIDTTNPPGNETEAARYIAGRLEAEGLPAALTESAPGRGNVTTRLPGGGNDPLLLLGHTDVVAVEPDKWTHPPFSGALVNGCVWGRGALDMKNMVAAELVVLLLIKRLGIRLDRDLMYAATADEEAGKGEHGPGWLLDHHPEQIDAPVILTEGGGHDLDFEGKRFYTCQVGQKGICRLRLTMRGRPGHGSVPHADNAVTLLCAALAPLATTDLPLHPSDGLRAFLTGLGQGQPSMLAADLMAVLDPGMSDQALQRLPIADKTRLSLRSLLRNSVSVTRLDAGSKINVIPSEATAWIDGRLAPGQTQESFLQELRGLIGDRVEIDVDQYSPPLEASADAPLFRCIEEVMDLVDPGVPVIPSLSTGGTDAKHIVPRRPDTQVYGFMPYRQAPGLEEENLIHGHDERTPVSELLFATRVLFDIVCRYGGASVLPQR